MKEWNFYNNQLSSRDLVWWLLLFTSKAVTRGDGAAQGPNMESLPSINLFSPPRLAQPMHNFAINLRLLKNCTIYLQFGELFIAIFCSTNNQDSNRPPSNSQVYWILHSDSTREFYDFQSNWKNYSYTFHRWKLQKLHKSKDDRKHNIECRW